MMRTSTVPRHRDSPAGFDTPRYTRCGRDADLTTCTAETVSALLLVTAGLLGRRFFLEIDRG